ncbi:hypothetical protein [Kitasatospora sp. CB01950]|uniref:hypothetical protein n=1 Tax=Kitasatospora sp. CB01950 TaxID=1703930 RepID=UPI00093BE5CA|nr:hypothetical protein [Kitasatospora sp. CB01950]OKJ06804.1 hypothetical protein AMK19_23400 [Kitasatospora sp. CB01950]
MSGPWVGGLTIREHGPGGRPTADYLCTRCTPYHHARLTGDDTRHAADLHTSHLATHHPKGTP